MRNIKHLSMLRSSRLSSNDTPPLGSGRKLVVGEVGRDDGGGDLAVLLENLGGGGGPKAGERFIASSCF